MNITLHQMKVFTVIVEKRSITRAAEELNMTQPAVSIQLKNLQTQFPTPLTEILKRRVYITDFGFEFYRIAEKVLTEIETINYKALGFQGALSGKLKISVVSTGKYVLPYFLSSFLKAHPNIDLSMDVTNKTRVIRSLEDNEVDFSLLSVLPTRLEVMEEILMPNKWFLVGSKDQNIPAAPSSRKLDKSVFKNLPLIYREEGSGTRYIMQQYFRQSNIRPTISLELASDEAVKQAVIAGLGFSILSILTLKNELKQKDIRIIPIRGLPLKSDWRLIWLKKKNLSVVAQAYLNYVRQQKEKIYKDQFSWMENY